MGNAQSAEKHHHEQNKLAKPRTNTNESPSSVRSRYANLTPSDRQNIKSLLLSPPVPLEKDFEQTSSDTSSAPQQPNITTRSNSLSCFRRHRNSSSKLQSLSSSKVSLPSCNHAVDPESAMQILDGVKRSSSPEELAAFTQALQSQPSEPLANTTEQGRLSRRSSLLNRSTSSLFRRRSQISTQRDSLTERKRWSSWRTPTLDPEEEARWSQNTSGSSPRLQRTTLELPDEKTSDATPRAQTPGDREYTHLGSLRLGSLRIANGPPSPAASTRFADHNAPANLSHDEDYFMVADNSEGLMMKSTKRHRRTKSAAASTTPPLYRKLRLSTSSRRAKTLSRVDSPLKTDLLSTVATPEMHVYDDDDAPEPMRRLRVMNKSQETMMTRDYRSDVDELETQCDLSFGGQSPQVVSDVRFGEPLTTIHSSAFSTSFSVRTSEAEAEAEVETAVANVQPRTHTTEIIRPPPTKSDSGYASEGSFVTVPRKPLPMNSPFNVVVDRCSTDPGVPQIASHFVSPPPLPLVPASENVQQDLLQAKTLQRVEHPSLSLCVQRGNDHESFSPGSPCTDMCKSPVSITSKFSIDSKASLSKRLQKKKPSQQQLPFVQTCDPVPDSQIPDIPTNVHAHFVRRMSETPGMECLERTYASKDHENDSASQAESIKAVPIVFPSPSESPEQRGRHHKRSNTERPSSPSSSSRGFRRSLSLFRSRSKAKREKEKETPASSTLVDLGSISSSLGHSPYDVAMPSVTRTVTSPTHPHQLGSMSLSAKPGVGMDARTAVDYARTRSKDLALSRPQMAQRPQSYHDSVVDGGQGSPYRSRSRISHGGNVPRMPAERPSTASASIPVPTRASAAVPNVTVPNASTRTQRSPAPAPAPSGSQIRARSTGRGRVVSEIVTKFDQFEQTRPSREEWEAHAQLQKQRRKSVGENLHEQQPRRQRSFTAYSSSRPPLSSSVNTSHPGYVYGGYGAPVRQLHSYVNRRGAQYNDHYGYGVDLFNVPVLHRA